MASQFYFDETKWPLLIVTAPDEPDDGAFTGYLMRLSAILARKQHYVVILDATHAVNLTTEHRLQMAAWLKQNREALSHYCQGAAFVIENKFVKGLLSAILLFAPMPYANKVTGTIAEAVAWSQTRMVLKKTA